MVLRGLRALECPLEQHDEHHYYPYLEYAGISAGRWQCCPAGMSQIFFFNLWTLALHFLILEPYN